MKRSIFLTAPLVLAFSMMLASAQPTVQLTLKSYDEFAKAVNSVGKAIGPNARTEVAQDLREGLGLTNLASFDTKKPWELAVWFEGEGEPLLAVKGPIPDVKKFKATLDPDEVLHDEVKDVAQLDNGMGLLVFKALKDLSATDKAALDKWKSQPIQAPGKTLEINLRLSEPVRAQLTEGLETIRQLLTQTLGQNPTLSQGGINPKAMTEMLGLYFDAMDAVVKGFGEMKVGADVTADAITFDDVLSAKSGTELAQWLQAPASPLTAADLTGQDPQALASFAMYMGKSDNLVKLVQKLMSLSLQLQNAQTNDAVVKDITAMMEKMLPAKFSGSFNLKNGFGFSGVYTFPNNNGAEAYAEMKRVFNGSMKSLVGKDQLYSAVSFAEKDHTVSGTPVDRFSFTLNLDNPQLQVPGQKESIEAMFPKGKLELDYALKGGKLFLSSAGGNEMQDLLEGKLTGNSSLPLEKNTVLTGSVNVLEAMKAFVRLSPLVPEEAKEILAKANTQGTAVQFQLGLDGRLHAMGQIPLKLLREIARLEEQSR